MNLNYAILGYFMKTILSLFKNILLTGESGGGGGKKCKKKAKVENRKDGLQINPSWRSGMADCFVLLSKFIEKLTLLGKETVCTGVKLIAVSNRRK